MARRIREYDWASTPLGRIESWPPNLRTAVDLCLGMQAPGALFWGPSFIMLHNDAERRLLGGLSATALGRPGPEVLTDSWPMLEGPIRQALSTGSGVSSSDLTITFDRGGERRPTHGVAFFTPVHDDDGNPAGVLVTGIETTDRFHAFEALQQREAKQLFLLKLSDALRPLEDPLDIQETVVRLLAQHLGVDWAYYGEVDPTMKYMIVQREYVHAGAPSLAGVHPLSSFALLGDLQQGQTVDVEDMLTSDRIDEGTRERLGQIGMRSFMGAPVMKSRDHLLAGLIVAARKARRWTPDERELVEDTADRTWAAVERSRAQAALREQERRLQALYDAAPQLMGVGEIETDRIEVITANASAGSFLDALSDWETVGIEAGLAPEPEIAKLWLASVAKSEQAGSPVRFEYFDSRSLQWLAVTVVALGNGLSGRRQFSFVADDITERKHQEANQAFLWEISRELVGPEDIEKTMARLGKEIADYLGVEQCLFADMFDGDQVSVAYGWSTHGAVDPSCLHDLSKYIPPEQMARHNAGEILVVRDFQTDSRFDPETCAAIGVRSIVVVPLAHEGLWRFMLLVADARPRDWSDSDIALIREIVDRLWLRLERARVEVSLRESEQRFRSLFESIDEGYALYELVFDDQGRPVDVQILGVNPAYETLTKRFQPSGKLLTEVTRALTPGWLEAMASVAKRQEAQRFERYNTEIDRWFDVYVTPADGPDPHRLLLVFNDITEQKRANEALRASEERYRSLFDSIDQGFCTIEVLFDETGHAHDYRFLEINPAFARNTGLNDVIGKRMRELEPTHEDYWFRIYGDVARTGVPTRFEAEAAALGRWYNVYAYPTGAAHEHRVAILFEDVTERQLGYAALRESEARFRAVANVVPDLLWQSAPDGMIDWYNDRWYEYTGCSPIETTGWSWIDVVHPDERAESSRETRNALVRGMPLQLERRLRAADGSYRWFLIRIEPSRDETGAIAYWFGAAADIHEERAARDELAARVEVATTALRSLSRRLILVQEEERRYLARELHDEIGQALTGLALTLAAAPARAGELGEAQRIVAELTEQVRQLSMDLRPSTLDTYGLLTAIHSLLKRYESQTGIIIELRVEGLDRRLPATIEVVAYRVVQEALTNVARHAQATSAIVQLIADDARLFVSVRDRGAGFDPTLVTEGSGIGGMRERVELLGGQFEIETALGIGVSITAELPLGTASPADLRQEVGPPA